MSSKYRAIIIDDERLARNDLKILLADFDQIDIIGEAENVSIAEKMIRQLKPDVVFLDIQLTGESGFDLIEKLDILPKIIFVTAFDEYAIRAFEANALDYLLKPINPARLANSIERLSIQEGIKDESSRQLEYHDRLFLNLNSQFRFLKVSSILSISAAGDYSQILTATGLKGLVKKSMKEWEKRLPGQYFCRIHRSSIINLEYIEKLEKWHNYSYRVYLKGEQQPYMMSRRYASRLKQRLG
jgi:two-component system LytT family response regulator